MDTGSLSRSTHPTLGRPWKCDPVPALEDLVTKSKIKYGWKDKSQITLMSDYEKYFKINAIGKERLDEVVKAESKNEIGGLAEEGNDLRRNERIGGGRGDVRASPRQPMTWRQPCSVG